MKKAIKSVVTQKIGSDKKKSKIQAKSQTNEIRTVNITDNNIG